MAPLRTIALIFAISLAYTVAEQLRCRVGEDLCKQLNWDHTGRINSNVVCCPPLSGQGFTMNMNLQAPDNCKCNAGSEEDYASDAFGLRAGCLLFHVLAGVLTWFVVRARLF